MRRGQRDSDTAGAPDASLHRDIGERGRHEKGDAGLLQVVGGAEERRGHAAGRRIEGIVGIRAISSDDRGAFG